MTGGGAARAGEYVRAHGTALERARLAAILWGESAGELALHELRARQGHDGGFAHWVPQVSNVCDTAYVLGWLHDLNLCRGPLADPACQFLLDRQLPDGGWDEIDAVNEFSPPEWMVPGRVETRVWLTAYCAHVLIRFGYAEAEGTRCPADFLLAHCDEVGRMAGYLRATWIALPMLAFYPGRRSRVFRKSLAVVEQAFRHDWPGSYVAWLLRCLFDSGLAARNPLVRRCLEHLEASQRADGSWTSEAGEEHAVDGTIDALRVLQDYGRIGRLVRPPRGT
jgi:hypothetical protein